MAYIRYAVLDKYFRDREERYTVYDLIRLCEEAIFIKLGKQLEISRQTILSDIHFLKSEGAPITKERMGKKMVYYYEDPLYSHFKHELNPSQKEHLSHALSVLRMFNANPSFEWIQDSIQMLEEQIQNKTEPPAMSRSQETATKGIEWIEKLLECIHHKQEIKISYTDFFNEKHLFDLSPYHLREYNGRWYVLGYNKGKARIINLGLERVQNIEVVGHEQFVDIQFDAQDWFRDIVGVTNYLDREVETIVFRAVSAQQAMYVKSRPVHHSLKELESQAHEFVFSINVKPNSELDAYFLSNLDRLSILSPESYRTHLQKRVDSNSL